MTLEINDLKKSYGDLEVLNNFNLEAKPGEIIQVAGETGRGKTTLKRCISGLEQYQEGEINVKGDIAFIFQDERILPWLNVRSNLLLPIKLKNEEVNSEIIERMEKYSKDLGVEEHLNKKVGEVSGGELQRLLIVRALISDPDLLLLDEPFNSLDKDTRNQLYTKIHNICKEKEITALIASHNQDLGNLGDRKVDL